MLDLILPTSFGPLPLKWHLQLIFMSLNTMEIKVYMEMDLLHFFFHFYIYIYIYVCVCVCVCRNMGFDLVSLNHMYRKDSSIRILA
jgi:hypothetical protein